MVKFDPPQTYLNKVYLDTKGNEWIVIASTHIGARSKQSLIITLANYTDRTKIVSVNFEKFMEERNARKLVYVRDEPRSEYKFERIKDLPEEFKYVWTCVVT